jgi:AcrR family transcriptional regulator
LYKHLESVTAIPASRTALPRHRVRATRDSGRRTRSALLDAAAELFAEHGLAGVSLTGIAAHADAFPSQVTYYFGSKEALFVEAASREVLHLASRVEAAGSRARTQAAYVRALTRVALGSPAMLAFAEAMLLARHRPELSPLVTRTLDRLHAEGSRAVTARCREAGWSLRGSGDSRARHFWAAVIGLVLERAASGERFDPRAAEAAILATLGIDDAPRRAASRRT